MLITLSLVACTTSEPEEVPRSAGSPSLPLDVPRHVSLFGVVPDHMHDGEPPSEARVALGRMLYFDARLSGDQAHSCATCHPLERYGTSAAPTSGPPTDRRPARNAPSTYHAALHFRQYWDGRVADIEAMVRDAFTDPQQMAMPTETAVVQRLASMPGYREAFAAAYPGDGAPIRYGTVGQALGSFLRTLVTPGSALDRYQQGDKEALTAEQLAGFDRFVDTGCVSCHSGPLFGGMMLQRLGAVHAVEAEDRGVATHSGQPADAYLFKVPSLRNVARTGPWLHDGSVKTLPAAVRLMAHHQLGRELDDEAVAEIVAFLETLTGPLPETARDVPELP